MYLIVLGLASPSDRKDFLEEFRTMTKIGYHPNVVSLIGACQHQGNLSFLNLSQVQSVHI